MAKQTTKKATAAKKPVVKPEEVVTPIAEKQVATLTPEEQKLVDEKTANLAPPLEDKNPGLTYEEAEKLMSIGQLIKLPEWEGFWFKNIKSDKVFVFTKEGEILDNPMDEYKDRNDWEVFVNTDAEVSKKLEDFQAKWDLVMENYKDLNGSYPGNDVSIEDLFLKSHEFFKKAVEAKFGLGNEIKEAEDNVLSQLENGMMGNVPETPQPIELHKSLEDILPEVKAGKKVKIKGEADVYFEFENGRLKKFHDNGTYLDSAPLYAYQDREFELVD